MAAARALGMMGEIAKEQVFTIAALLKDLNSEVRSTALQALRSMGEVTIAQAPQILALAKDVDEATFQSTIEIVMTGISRQTAGLHNCHIFRTYRVACPCGCTPGHWAAWG